MCQKIENGEREEENIKCMCEQCARCLLSVTPSSATTAHLPLSPLRHHWPPNISERIWSFSGRNQTNFRKKSLKVLNNNRSLSLSPWRTHWQPCKSLFLLPFLIFYQTWWNKFWQHGGWPTSNKDKNWLNCFKKGQCFNQKFALFLNKRIWQNYNTFFITHSSKNSLQLKSNRLSHVFSWQVVSSRPSIKTFSLS